MAVQDYCGKWDLSGMIRDYEFTRRSAANLRLLGESERFAGEDSDAIFQYLRNQMEIVYFGDFLRRYLYERCQFTDAFPDVPEEDYIHVIEDSFAMNRAPHAFGPVTSKWRNIVKRWLHAGAVKRSTVFLLGFGLRMPDQDVSMFLTKVLKEQDFNPNDPEEVLYWYCFHQGLSYAEALKLRREMEQEGDALPAEDRTEFWHSVQNELPLYLSNPKMLKEYYGWLNARAEAPKLRLFEAFQTLYERCLAGADQIVTRENLNLATRGSSSGAYVIERLLYSGVPRSDQRNLEPVASSLLQPILQSKRLDRQRLGRLLSEQAPVERFDLLTLQFLANLLTEQTSGIALAPKDRLLRFVDEANALLTGLNLWEIYPVNPYESFLLLCLLTEDPLCAYNDVWELSYESSSSLARD